jgi:hypothetical protein
MERFGIWSWGEGAKSSGWLCEFGPEGAPEFGAAPGRGLIWSSAEEATRIALMMRSALQQEGRRAHVFAAVIQ